MPVSIKKSVADFSLPSFFEMLCGKFHRPDKIIVHEISDCEIDRMAILQLFGYGLPEHLRCYDLAKAISDRINDASFQSGVESRMICFLRVLEARRGNKHGLH